MLDVAATPMAMLPVHSRFQPRDDIAYDSPCLRLFDRRLRFMV